MSELVLCSRKMQECFRGDKVCPFPRLALGDNPDTEWCKALSCAFHGRSVVRRRLGKADSWIVDFVGEGEDGGKSDD